MIPSKINISNLCARCVDKYVDQMLYFLTDQIFILMDKYFFEHAFFV